MQARCPAFVSAYKKKWFRHASDARVGAALLTCVAFNLIAGCRSSKAPPLTKTSSTQAAERSFGPFAGTDLPAAIAGVGLHSLPEREWEPLQKQFPPLFNDAFLERTAGVESRMRTMLSADFGATEHALLTSHGLVFEAFRLMRDRNFDAAKAVSTRVLKTQGLSPQIYRWALSAHLIGEIAALEALPAEEKERRVGGLTFQAWQNLHCESLCATKGWATLALEDSASLTIQGYANRLFARLQFELAGLQRPEWVAQLVGEGRRAAREKTKEGPGEDSGAEAAQVTSPTLVARMRSLMSSGRWSEASSLARRAPLPPVVRDCAPDAFYAQHVLAQASRFTQERGNYFGYQKNLVRLLETRLCQPRDFGMEDEQYDAFYLDAKIWLARLYWESGDLVACMEHAKQGLDASAAAGMWDFYMEAAQVLVGRAGFEAQTPQQNLAQLAEFKKQLEHFETNEFAAWIASREALLLFLDAKFAEAATRFEDLAKSAEDVNQIAFAHYWRGRSLKAIKQERLAENAFLSAGGADPMSIYDIFSGQLLGYKSGRASSVLTSPFVDPWTVEADRWIALKNEKPFLLFRPSTWFRAEPPSGARLYAAQGTRGTQGAEAVDTTRSATAAFDSSLRSALLLATFLRAAGDFSSFEEYSQYIRDSESLQARLLRSEIAWLRQSYMARPALRAEFTESSAKIAWLLHASGDYVNAILFVGSLRGSTAFDADSNSFLFFIFYPRAYGKHFEAAAARCSVDADLLFAIARQESLFVAGARSGAGAVGLMQLLPATAKRVLAPFEDRNGKPMDLTDPATNTLAGACYVRDLIKRYRGNLTYAIAAYNAGEAIVDRWVSARTKIPDAAFFIEFLPFAETKKYVQRVLRNYYNMKWIYASPRPGESAFGPEHGEYAAENMMDTP